MKRLGPQYDLEGLLDEKLYKCEIAVRCGDVFMMLSRRLSRIEEFFEEQAAALVPLTCRDRE